MYTKDHLNSAKMDLTENSRIVLEKRYLRKNSDGEIIETPEKMFARVASAIAEPENCMLRQEILIIGRVVFMKSCIP